MEVYGIHLLVYFLITLALLCILGLSPLYKILKEDIYQYALAKQDAISGKEIEDKAQIFLMVIAFALSGIVYWILLSLGFHETIVNFK